MLNNAINQAIKLLNDNTLCILSYAETGKYYLFVYGDLDKKPIFDNAMIKVDKETKIASYFIITEHLDEIDKLNFKEYKGTNK